jgi:hypothetical protein
VDLRGSLEMAAMIGELDIEAESGPDEGGDDAPWECPGCGRLHVVAFDTCPVCGFTAPANAKDLFKPLRGTPSQLVAVNAQMLSSDDEQTLVIMQEPAILGDEAQSVVIMEDDISGSAQDIVIASPSIPNVSRRALAQDVKNGFTDGELMQRYGCGYKALQALFKELLDDGLIDPGELYGRSSLYMRTVAAQADLPEDRQGHYLAFPIPVYDERDPSIVGRMRYVTDDEVGLIGIDAQVNETKSLIILPEKFIEIKSFKFKARCKWVRREAEGAYTGFEIVNISDDAFARLQQLTEALTFGSFGD